VKPSSASKNPPIVRRRASVSSKATVSGGTTPLSDTSETIPARWRRHYRLLRRLRDEVLQAHATHREQTVDPDTTDDDPEDANLEVLLTKLSGEKDQLFEIDCALERIREGTYGFCEETGRPIRPARLRAIPWARYDVG